ncbi:putative Vacuolar protein sorting 55 [Monocercomonoides exilis]|uniref:putative Vacuolar protein sorting 55 n=1 Tax=Monocercomonoides exilis TaxID=2049356 RepID=UPI00355AC447|nr:putative Vacuolar protein sorting 55 [Monocercomonoides exilis]|eukprot:MONOS_6185.1-p1 / transcript=MONOS_6185.1 / gene=MONOS_6185 / organism=Monocercomonoides_exilis_PA203 / gene_product=unspecified product / transcript_product=unspecified product / location=Mono_scaffold00191:77306-77900(-) / protein_length=132 / sequence_SO=supercontig / SO=protein_coding / is_pseudo=false
MLTPLKIVILAVCATCGLTCTIVGCAVGNNWWCLFGYVFLACAAICLFIYSQYMGSADLTSHHFFMLLGGIILLISGLALMLVLYHGKVYQALVVLILNVIGYTIFIVTAVLALLLDKPSGSSGGIPAFVYG